MIPEKIKLNPTDLSTYCPELWSRAYISQQNNQFAYKPCCYFRPSNNDVLTDFTSIYNDLNQKHQTIRIESLQGKKDIGCSYCYNLEQSLESSPRINAVEKYGTDVTLISHLDLNLGTLCNLSCAICGPFNSSSWVPIAERGWNSVDPVFKYKAKNRQVIDDPQLFLQLKTIQLQGGEIFLEDGYQTFFENLGKYRTYENLEVMIFTNGTVKPSYEFVNILNRCKEVRIFFSVDDVKERFEYQRRGAKWDEVINNIKWFQENLYATYGFNITYSLYNIYYLDQIQKTLSNLFPNLYQNYSAFNTGMANCSAEFLQQEHYDIIRNKIEQVPELEFIKNFIKIKSNPYNEFIDYVKKYDKLTGTSYPNTHPEFWTLINN